MRHFYLHVHILQHPLVRNIPDVIFYILLLYIYVFYILQVGLSVFGTPIDTQTDVVDTDELSITCMFRGLPAPTVTWSRTQHFSVTSQTYRETGDRVSQYVTSSVLTWDPEVSYTERRQTSGSISCEGDNEISKIPQTTNINVQCEFELSVISYNCPVNDDNLQTLFTNLTLSYIIIILYRPQFPADLNPGHTWCYLYR